MANVKNSKVPHCQFDWRDDVTLHCSAHNHYVLTIVSGRERTLKRLFTLGLLEREGKAWWDAITLEGKI